MTLRKTVAVLVAITATPLCVPGQESFTSRAAFVTRTSAVPEPALPNLGRTGGGIPVTVGRLTFTSPLGTWIGMGNAQQWSAVIVGEEVAIDGREDFDIDIAGIAFAIGFDFDEPTLAGRGVGTCWANPCVASTFSIRLIRSGVGVGGATFTGGPPFIGLYSSEPFDRVEVREIAGAIDDEYFGNFLLGSAPRASCSFRNGTGVNPGGYICTTSPILGTTWTSEVPTSAMTTSTLVAISATSATIPFLGGELLVTAGTGLLSSTGLGSHSVPVPNDTALLGVRLASQGIRLERVTAGVRVDLFNAQDLVLGR